MKIKNIKLVVFDVYGTCFDIHSTSSLLKKYIGKNWKNFSNLWRTKQLEYSWIRTIMNQYVDFWKITNDALDYTLEVYKKNKIKKKILNSYKFLKPYSDLELLINFLKKKKIPRYILTNGSSLIIKNLLKKYKMNRDFNKILSVDRIKIFKPSPKVYQIVTNNFKCPSKNILFLSSNCWDIAGAKNFGFKTAWINRNKIKFDKLGLYPDIELQSLNNIRKIFN